MEQVTDMGNCLPLLFPSLLRADDHSPLEEVSENRDRDLSNPAQQSSYVNELWVLEASNGRQETEHFAEDPGKAQLSVMLEQIPADTYAEGKMTETECPICMNDFVNGDQIRYLPCMHCYHKKCVDDWLMRSFTCPSCMEPVDSAILSSFTAYTVKGLEALKCSPATSGRLHKPV